MSISDIVNNLRASSYRSLNAVLFDVDLVGGSVSDTIARAIVSQLAVSGDYRALSVSCCWQMLSNCVLFNGDDSEYAVDARKTVKLLKTALRRSVKPPPPEYDLPAYFAADEDTPQMIAVSRTVETFCVVSAHFFSL